MSDFIEQLKASIRRLGIKIRQMWAKLWGKPVPDDNGSVINLTVKTDYEINLVPNVKAQMIRAQKMRNYVLFLCIVISSVAIGVVVILFGVKSGQDIAMSNQDSKLELLSKKLNGYSELSNLITVQGQLQGIDDITDQKTVFSRVFGALGAMLPQGSDSVKLSQLSVNMETGVLRMDGQADARIDPLIDYRVLESFKKGVELTKYDYGNYVDADGNRIPTYCISETDDDGNAYKVGDSYYAWWDLTIEGCEASQRGGITVPGAEYHFSSTAEVERGTVSYETVAETVCNDNDENCITQEGVVERPEIVEGEELYKNDGLVPIRVKIWRTPQFNAWYEAGRMTLDGYISSVEHFDSECYSYRGAAANGSVRWTSTNDCLLAIDGLTVSNSSNARDESDNLVLKFTGSVKINKNFFDFSHRHMIAIGPMGQNVTDSFIQVGGMFTQAAVECEPDDVECLNNSSNSGGN